MMSITSPALGIVARKPTVRYERGLEAESPTLKKGRIIMTFFEGNAQKINLVFLLENLVG